MPGPSLLAHWRSNQLEEMTDQFVMFDLYNPQIKILNLSLNIYPSYLYWLSKEPGSLKIIR